MYHFLDLTPEQNLTRRHALDWYGMVAQISVLIPLVLIQYGFLVRWGIQRWRANAQRDPPSSPLAKDIRLGKLAMFESMMRNVAWWANDEVTILGARLGTKGEVIGALTWLLWLVILCFLQTGDDYLHVTKRFGIIASSQLPCHYSLALKSPYSPLQILTRTSHETINGLHQQLGRIMTIMLWVHAILYINFFIMKNLVLVKIQQLYIICGLLGILALTVIGTTAMAPVRRRSYRVFYTVHVALATMMLPLLYFHVSHIRPYLYQTAAIYAANTILRKLTSRTIAGTVTMVPGTNLVEIKIKHPQMNHSRFRHWHPGQHAYIAIASSPFLTTFRSNPFTVASLPSVDGELKFIARILDGNTRKLAHTAAKSNHAEVNHDVTIEGPYGISSHAVRLLSYNRVLIIAGGVGATFAVPLYRQLLADLSPSRRSYRRQHVSFVWIARSQADVRWALPENTVEEEGFVERLRVCITGHEVEDRTTTSSTFSIGNEDDDAHGAHLGETEEEGIELEEQKQLLPDSEDQNGDGTHGTLPISNGRPDISRLIDQTFAHGPSERVAILVCGPRLLNRSVRKEVGRWVAKGRDVWFWDEQFAF